jgi:hypothetical protein
MGVALIRNALKHTRKSWESHRPDHIFYPSNLLPPEYFQMTFEQFNLHFVVEHHRKRHNKGQGAKNRKSFDEEEEEDEDPFQ